MGRILKKPHLSTTHTYFPFSQYSLYNVIQYCTAFTLYYVSRPAWNVEVYRSNITIIPWYFYIMRVGFKRFYCLRESKQTNLHVYNRIIMLKTTCDLQDFYDSIVILRINTFLKAGGESNNWEEQCCPNKSESYLHSQGYCMGRVYKTIIVQPRVLEMLLTKPGLWLDDILFRAQIISHSDSTQIESMTQEQKGSVGYLT